MNKTQASLSLALLCGIYAATLDGEPTMQLIINGLALTYCATSIYHALKKDNPPTQPDPIQTTHKPS